VHLGGPQAKAGNISQTLSRSRTGIDFGSSAYHHPFSGITPGNLFSDGGGDFCAKKLDGVHNLLVGHRTDAHHQQKALVVKDFVLE
jgi:hypothetical protein